jgi:two-component system phosphate regulon response regulator PhoB
MSASILSIDPDRATQELLSLNLGRAGHRLQCVADADAGLAACARQRPDLLLLEWDLPLQSGIVLIRRLRAQAATRTLPIIMLSARSFEHDIFLALESGADDYLLKPFNPRLALARIAALLRRSAPPPAPDAVAPGGLRLDPATHRVMAGYVPLVLGRVEFRLLNFLMLHPERVHTRAQLLDQVWGNDVYLDERTVDRHVGRLRSALQQSGCHEYIETVRGSGYRFVAWQAQAQATVARAIAEA